MASGALSGPPPDRLYVLKNAYEIRYFTSPEMISEAILEGYGKGAEVAVYRKAEVPPVDEIAKIMRANPIPPSPPSPATWTLTVSPAHQAAAKTWERSRKAWKKKVKPLLVALLERY